MEMGDTADPCAVGKARFGGEKEEADKGLRVRGGGGGVGGG